MISCGNRTAIDNGFGYDLYDNGRYVGCVATPAEAECFVHGGEL